MSNNTKETFEDAVRFIVGAGLFGILAILFIPVAAITFVGIALMEIPKAYSLLVAYYEEGRHEKK